MKIDRIMRWVCLVAVVVALGIADILLPHHTWLVVFTWAFTVPVSIALTIFWWMFPRWFR